MKNFLYAFVDLIFPSYCVSCGDVISISDRSFCNKCYEEIEFCENSCDICSGEMIEGECSVCKDRKFFVTRHYSIVKYQDSIKELIHHYKFRSRKRLSSHLVKLVYNEMRDKNIIIDIITSVPLNKKKIYKRGYNQSEVIAKKVSKLLTVPYVKTLKDCGKNIDQKKLGYRERFLNTIGKYELIEKESILNKKILIVDDVFTTGATINECGRVLKEAGSGEIYSIAIARVDSN